MINHKDGVTTIVCDGPDCDATDEFDRIRDISLFKEVVRESGWHLRKHSKCLCMDCWEAGIR
jgi:hypothetical protein